MRVVYYDPGGSDPPAAFRSGEVSSVALDADGDARVAARVALGPNALHALWGHGVVDALRRLPLASGELAPGRVAVLRPTAVSDAARILYEADRKTYGGRWEFCVAREDGVEYRLAVDNREYQASLARLQYLVTLSGREGRAVRLHL